NDQPLLLQRVKRVAPWAALALVITWLALAANAWRYFSGASLERAYLSAIHAIDVLNLPAADTPPDLGDKRALSKREHEALTRYHSLRVSRGERPNQSETYAFYRPNVAVFYGHLGLSEGVNLHYVILKDRFCNLPTSGLPAYCYNYYQDPAGNLFRYFGRSGP